MLTEQGLLQRAQERSDFATKITVSLAAYATGNAVGNIMTIDNSSSGRGPIPEPPLSTLLQDLAVFDPSSQSPPLDLFFFNSLPTTPTDKTAWAPTSADMQACVGVVSVANADYAAAGAIGTIAAGKNQSALGKVLKPAALVSPLKGTALYCIAVARGSFTPTVASLFFRFKFNA